jgi:hypothetical protein
MVRSLPPKAQCDSPSSHGTSQRVPGTLDSFVRRVIALGLSATLLAGCTRASHSIHPGETFDAGAVFSVDTPTLTHEFRVQNPTRRAVRILDERHTCDCAKVVLDKREIPPGGFLSLTMRVNVPVVYTKRNVGCTLETDLVDHPNWTYSLAFESFPKV